MASLALPLLRGFRQSKQSSTSAWGAVVRADPSKRRCTSLVPEHGPLRDTNQPRALGAVF